MRVELTSMPPAEGLSGRAAGGPPLTAQLARDLLQLVPRPAAKEMLDLEHVLALVVCRLRAAAKDWMRSAGRKDAAPPPPPRCGLGLPPRGLRGLCWARGLNGLWSLSFGGSEPRPAKVGEKNAGRPRGLGDDAPAPGLPTGGRSPTMGSLSAGPPIVIAFVGVAPRERDPGPGERPNFAPGLCPRGLRFAGEDDRSRVTGDVEAAMDVPIVSRRGSRPFCGETAGERGCFDGWPPRPRVGDETSRDSRTRSRSGSFHCVLYP